MAIIGGGGGSPPVSPYTNYAQHGLSGYSPIMGVGGGTPGPYPNPTGGAPLTPPTQGFPGLAPMTTPGAQPLTPFSPQSPQFPMQRQDILNQLHQTLAEITQQQNILPRQAAIQRQRVNQQRTVSLGQTNDQDAERGLAISGIRGTDLSKVNRASDQQLQDIAANLANTLMGLSNQSAEARLAALGQLHGAAFDAYNFALQNAGLYSGGGAYASPSGANASYYAGVLHSLGAPVTKQNLAAMSAWAQSEGTQASWNPFAFSSAATPNAPGTWFNSFGSGPWHVWNLPSAASGIKWTAKTLLEPRYAGILHALRSNAGAGVIGAILSSGWGSHPSTSMYWNWLNQVTLPKSKSKSGGGSSGHGPGGGGHGIQ